MRGRKPTPTMLRALHGNPSKDKPPIHEPIPVGDLSDPPDYFTDDQKESWNYALKHAPPGLLKYIDRGMLAVWVAAEDLHRQAMKEQAKRGLLWRAPGSAYPQQSPFLPIINRQALIMIKAASEMGFSPVSRPRVYAGTQPVGQGLHATSQLKGKSGYREAVSLDEFLDSAPPRPTLN